MNCTSYWEGTASNGMNDTFGIEASRNTVGLDEIWLFREPNVAAYAVTLG